jgi:prevent-host-death family protein
MVKELMEKELGITQARIEFSNIVEKVQHRGDSYIINRHGKPAAAVVPVQVYETWKRQREEFFNQIREHQAQADLDPDEAERLAAHAVSDVRAES